MFDAAGRLVKPPSLDLHSRGRNQIENEVAPAPGPKKVAEFAALRKKHGQNWRVIREPYGRCNCAGMIWASRRTAIYEQSAWDLIFKDDQYRIIQETEVVEGDLAVYESPLAKIRHLHVGLVIGRDVLFGLNGQVPLVLSKFSDTSGEIVHKANDIIAIFPSEFGVQLKYWTDR
jgi:hypothetical protein